MNKFGIGQPVLRDEDIKFISGKGLYTGDISLEKQTFMYVLRSNIAHGEIKNIDLLYHESTFLNEHKDLALKTLHSTAEQAAKIATLAKVDKLLLGHFSTRYKDKSSFLNEARLQFKNTYLAEEGETYKL